MNKQNLRAIIGDLENICFRLSLDVIDQPERVDDFAAQFQRALDNAQQRLDDQRPRETAGNIFPSRPTPADLCIQCGRYWAPAGRLLCAICQQPPSYVASQYRDEDRERDAEITDAIRSRPQTFPGKDDRE